MKLEDAYILWANSKLRQFEITVFKIQELFVYETFIKFVNIFVEVPPVDKQFKTSDVGKIKNSIQKIKRSKFLPDEYSCDISLLMSGDEEEVHEFLWCFISFDIFRISKNFNIWFKSESYNCDDWIQGAHKRLLEILSEYTKIKSGNRNFQLRNFSEFCNTKTLEGFINSIVPALVSSEIMPNCLWTVDFLLFQLCKLFGLNIYLTFTDLSNPYISTVYFFLVLDSVVKFENFRKNQVSPVRFQTQHDKRLGEYFLSNNDCDPNIVKNMDRAITNIYETFRNIFDCRFIKIKLSDATEVEKLYLYFDANIGENVYSFYVKPENERLKFDKSFIFEEKTTNKVLTWRHEKFFNLSLQPIGKVSKKYNVFKIMRKKNYVVNVGEEIIGQIFPVSGDYFEFFLTKSIFKKDATVVRFLRNVFSRDFKELCNKKGSDSPLFVSVINGSKNITKELLIGGASVDVKDDNENTPLHRALMTKQYGIPQILIEWGASLDSLNSDKKNPLDFCLPSVVANKKLYEKSGLDVSKLSSSKLLSDFINLKLISNINTRISGITTLLHQSVIIDSATCLVELLKLGGDIDVTDKDGKGLLCFVNSIYVLMVILENEVKLDKTDLDGNTALHWNARRSEETIPTIIDHLIQAGLNVVARNNESLLPFHLAALNGRVDVCQSFLIRDEVLIKTAILKEGQGYPQSPIFYSLLNGHVECAKFLQKSGFYFKNDELRILMNMTAANEIKGENIYDVMKYLLEEGVDPNSCVVNTNNTALHYSAALFGEGDVIRLLLKHGADYTLQNVNGETPLAVAVKFGAVNAARILMDAVILSGLKPDYRVFEKVGEIKDWVSSRLFSNDEIKMIKYMYMSSKVKKIAFIEEKLNKAIN